MDADELSRALQSMRIGDIERERTPTPEIKQQVAEAPQTPVHQTATATATTREAADGADALSSGIPNPLLRTPEDKITGQIKVEEQDDLEEFTKLFKHKLAVTDTTTRVQDQTLIVLSPLAYEHRFSRSWVPKRYISTIVERPERIRATCLGIGAAMSELPHRFKLESSSRRQNLCHKPHVAVVHGEQWAQRLYKLCQESQAQLARGQIEVPEDWNSGDIYLSAGTIDALEGNIGALEQALDAVFDDDTKKQNKAFVSLRPPGHHSHPCVPSGFCLINNVHIGIQYAAAKFGVTHAVILDFDLHHGDGSQDITWDLNFENTKGPRIGYFSVHDIHSFPTERGYAAAEHIKDASTCVMGHDMAIWNVHLQPYDSEQQFTQHYKDDYSVLFTKARQFLAAAAAKYAVAAASPEAALPPKFKPLVMLSAGFDASEFETQSMQRHGVHVPTFFYNQFSRDALELAREFEAPVVSVLEGGYSDAALSTGTFSHLTGLADLEWRWTIDANCVKEFERGCKSRFAIGAAGTWVTEGVLLGRSLWPKSALTAMTPHVAATTGKKNIHNARMSNLDVLATPSRVLRDRTRVPPSAKR